LFCSAAPIVSSFPYSPCFRPVGGASTATLGLPLEVPAQGGRLAFDLWYDTEEDYDVGGLQASTDGGATWTNVPLELRTGKHRWRSEEHTSELQSRENLVCRLL